MASDSGKSNLVTAASIQMRAEIYSYSSDSLRGLLYSMYLDEPYEFVSLVQMIEKMEQIFDTKGFPEAFMASRMFDTSKNSRKISELDGNATMKEALITKIRPDPGLSQCTFEINVKFRQNATWQGQILWVEKNLKQNFRSVLEMLKLMDEALLDEEAKLDSIKWDSES